MEQHHEKTCCENKGADQQCCNRAADQHLCFRSIDSSIPLSKSKISNLLPSSVVVQPGLCWTWSETPKMGFLAMRLNEYYLDMYCRIKFCNHDQIWTLSNSQSGVII